MTKLRNILTCSLIASGIFALAGIGTLAFQLRESLMGLTAQADKTLSSVQATADQSKAAIGDTRDGTKRAIADLRSEYKEMKPKLQAAIAGSQAEQKAYWKDMRGKTTALLDSGKAALDELANTEKIVGEGVGGSLEHVNSAVDRLGPAIDSLGQTAQAAANQINAVDVKFVNGAIHNIDTVTGNMAQATGDIKGYVHRVTAPVRGFKAWGKTIAKGLIGLAPAARAFVP